MYSKIPSAQKKSTKCNQIIKKKLMKKLLLTIAGALLALPSMARDFTYEYEGQTLTYTVLDETSKTCQTKVGGRNYTYFAGNISEGNLTIPSVAKDGDMEYTVTAVGNLGFYRNDKLSSIIIPETIKNIGHSAFESCSALKSLTIPTSVTKIGNCAFEYCIGLTAITLSNSLTTIGDYAFHFCTNLNSITLPASLISIGASAFWECTALTSMTLPASVTSVGGSAFRGCTGLTSIKCLSNNAPVTTGPTDEAVYGKAVLYLPEGAGADYFTSAWNSFKDIRIGEASASYSDGNLTYRLVPSTTDGGRNLAVVTAGDYSALTEATIPQRFTYEAGGTSTRYYVDAVGYGAFKDCTALTKVTFHSRNESQTISDYAFSGCTALASVNIPSSVTSIGDYAFSGCTALASVEIPSSVTSVGNYAFQDCRELKTLVLNEGLETIGSGAFCNIGGTGQLNIPSTLKKVGGYAFYGVVFEKVNISDLAAWCVIDFGGPEANPAFGSKSLYLNGELIEDLVIPESVETIGGNTFVFNTALKSVTFPEGLKSIGTEFKGSDNMYYGGCSFVGCTGLTSVTFPASLQFIGLYSFCSCSALSSVKLNDGLESIGHLAFSGCDLKSVTIPGNVTKIDACAFDSNKSLTSLTFAYGKKPLDIVGPGTMSSCNTIVWDRPMDGMYFYPVSLTIGNSVTEIPASRFKNRTSLKSLTLGSGVTSIGAEAFSGCTALESVVLPPAVESIGASAFAGDTKLATITMGSNVKTIGELAFDGCPATTIHITAPNPPAAPYSNIFSNYNGTLYVQGQDAVDKYYDEVSCFDHFDAVAMTEPTGIEMADHPTTLTGKAGDTFQLTATLVPADVTLPHVFWRSTDPDIASVDNNGLVTIHADSDETLALAAENSESQYGRTCKIIAESLYANGPVIEVTVNDIASGIENITPETTPAGQIDYNAPYEVYSLQGMNVGRTLDGLTPGIYIVRQANNVKKILVK